MKGNNYKVTDFGGRTTDKQAHKPFVWNRTEAADLKFQGKLIELVNENSAVKN